MSKPKHTPGPWRACEESILAPIPTRTDCVEFVLKPGEQDIFQFKKEILLGYTPWIQFEPKSWAEMQKANTTLMAAAPELLEACEEVLDDLDTPEHNLEGWVIEMLKNVIAKAKGD